MRSAAIALMCMCAAAAPAIADPEPAIPSAPPFARLLSPRIACLGSPQAPTACVQLAAGYYLDEPTYDALDRALKQLQDDTTRLTAENELLRAAISGWHPGWVTLAVSFAAGAGLAVYVVEKL